LRKSAGTTHFPRGEYLLCADIELEDWIPIGVFSGDLEGDGRTMRLNSFASNGDEGALSETGLFGSILGDSASARAGVQNLRINYAAAPVEFNDADACSTGALAGIVENAVIKNITLEGD
jgi:hypothetical protein